MRIGVGGALPAAPRLRARPAEVVGYVGAVYWGVWEVGVALPDKSNEKWWA